MRIDLAEHINQYVLCKGWITDWKQINEDTFRAYIDKPIIKKPNKDKVSDDLELLSVENHINLFLPFKNDGKNKLPYTRSDATTDFGVYPIAQSKLHQDLMEMDDYISALTDRFNASSVELLMHLEKNGKPFILHLEEELIDAGDLLPTFYHTYDFYQNEIDEWKELISKLFKMIRTIHSNRRLRRKHKASENLAINVPEFNFDDAVAKMLKPSKHTNKKALKKARRKH